MTNYREILRLNKLGISKAQIAAGCGCARSTIQRVLQRAEMCNLVHRQRAKECDCFSYIILLCPTVRTVSLYAVTGLVKNSTEKR